MKCIVIFDYSKLRGRIREKNLTEKALAEKLGMNPSTFSLKINNQTYFTQEDIFNIVDVLEIPPAELKVYFFTEKV